MHLKCGGGSFYPFCDQLCHTLNKYFSKSNKVVLGEDLNVNFNNRSAESDSLLDIVHSYRLNKEPTRIQMDSNSNLHKSKIEYFLKNFSTDIYEKCVEEFDRDDHCALLFTLKQFTCTENLKTLGKLCMTIRRRTCWLTNVCYTEL